MTKFFLGDSKFVIFPHYSKKLRQINLHEFSHCYESFVCIIILCNKNLVTTMYKNFNYVVVFTEIQSSNFSRKNLWMIDFTKVWHTITIMKLPHSVCTHRERERAIDFNLNTYIRFFSSYMIISSSTNSIYVF